MLEPYREEVAQAKEWLILMKKHADEQLVFYVALDDQQMAIMTHKHLFLVKNGESSGKVIVTNVRFISAYKNRDTYILRIGGNAQLVIVTHEREPVIALFDAIMLMPTQLDPNTKLNIFSGPDPND